MDRKDFIKTVKEIQEKKKLTDKELAKLLGIDISLWNKLKKNHRNPSLRVLKAISNALPELQLKIMEYINS